jgi:hypothetical protein
VKNCVQNCFIASAKGDLKSRGIWPRTRPKSSLAAALIPGTVRRDSRPSVAGPILL